MNPYELFALDWYLSEYPEDKEFDEILDMVAEASDDVYPLEDYEDFCGSHLAGMIEELAIALERNFLFIRDYDA
jgi:hypothetical protein